MANFTPAAIVRAFGGCAGHRALAFRSLFAALDAKPREYPPPGIGWLNRRAMVALLRPAPPLAAVVGQLEQCLTSGCDGNAAGEAGADGAPAGARARARAAARVRAPATRRLRGGVRQVRGGDRVEIAAAVGALSRSAWSHLGVGIAPTRLQRYPSPSPLASASASASLSPSP